MWVRCGVGVVQTPHPPQTLYLSWFEAHKGRRVGAFANFFFHSPSGMNVLSEKFGTFKNTLYICSVNARRDKAKQQRNQLNQQLGF